MIKGSVHHKNIMIANLYVSNIRTPSFMKQTPLDLKEEKDSIPHSHQLIDHPDKKFFKKLGTNYII
jgi:hypothetical protein